MQANRNGEDVCPVFLAYLAIPKTNPFDTRVREDGWKKSDFSESCCFAAFVRGSSEIYFMKNSFHLYRRVIFDMRCQFVARIVLNENLILNHNHIPINSKLL